MSVSFVMRGCLISLLLLLQSCGGGGGGSGGDTSANSQTVTPYPVLSSSFENKAVAGLPVELTQLPKLSVAIGGTFVNGWDSVAESLAVADFKRDRTYTAFVIVSDRLSAAKAFFVSHTAAGGYQEVTGLFETAADQVACPFPQQSLVADLNGGTRPDIYVACAGSASGAPQAVEQYVYLSQSNGKFQMKTTRTLASTPTSLHANSASLADIDGDGCQDVVTTNGGSLVLMRGSCTGQQYTLYEPSHAANSGRLPALNSGDPPSSVQGVFLIPRTNRYDLIVAGQGNQGTPVKWFYNSAGYFGPSLTQAGRDVRGYAIAPQYVSTRYDYVESSSSGYLYITNAQNFERLVKIAKPELQTGLDLTPWYYSPADKVNPVNNWPSALRVMTDGNLRPYDAGCDATTRCTKVFSLTTGYGTVWP